MRALKVCGWLALGVGNVLGMMLAARSSWMAGFFALGLACCLLKALAAGDRDGH